MKKTLAVHACIVASLLALNSNSVEASTVSTVSTSTDLPLGTPLWATQTGPKRLPSTLHSDTVLTGNNGTIYVVEDERDMPGSSPNGKEATQVHAINATNGHTNWTLSLQYPTFTRPVLGKDGTLYILTTNSFQTAPLGSDVMVPISAGLSILYAVSSSGHVKWSTHLYTDTGNSLVVGSNGNVYVGLNKGAPFNGKGNYGGSVIAMTPGGVKLWSKSIPYGDGVYSMTSAPGGSVYVETASPPNETNLPDSIYAFDANGHIRWKALGLASLTPSCVGSDGTVYCGDLYHITGQKQFRLLAFNSKNGSLMWSIHPFSSLVYVFASSNHDLFCTDSNFIYAINEHHQILWKRSVSLSFPSKFSLENGTIDYLEVHPYDQNGPNRLEHLPSYDVLGINPSRGELAFKLGLPYLGNGGTYAAAPNTRMIYVEDLGMNELTAYRPRPLPVPHKPTKLEALLSKVWSVTITAAHDVVQAGEPDKLTVKAFTKSGQEIHVPSSAIHYLMWNVSGGNSKRATLNLKTNEFTALDQNQRYEVTAIINNVAPIHPAVINIASPPSSLVFTAPSKLVASPSGAEPLTIIAENQYGSPITNVPITLQSDNPTILSLGHAQVTTNDFGLAEVSMVPGSNPGTAHITATSGNAKGVVTVQVVPQPSNITISAGRSTFVANVADDSTDTTQATITVTNADGTPAAGLLIHFSRDNTVITVPPSVITDVYGTASVPISSSLPGNTGNENITASVGSAKVTLHMSVIADINRSESTVTSMPSFFPTQASFPVDVTVVDLDGNPLNKLMWSAFVLRFSNSSGTVNVPAKFITSQDSSGHYELEFDLPNNVPKGSETVRLYVNGVLVGSTYSIP